MDKKPIEIAVEGVDGVGKSSVANALVERLAPYHQPYTCNIYHTARQINGGDDLYPLWATYSGSVKAIDLLKSALVQERDRASEAGAGLIVWDRNWLTAFTEIGNDPELVDVWGDDMPRTALLLPAGDHIARATDNDTWDQPTEREQYKRRYQEQAWAHFSRMIGHYLMDRRNMDWSVSAVASQIDSDMRYRR